MRCNELMMTMERTRTPFSGARLALLPMFAFVPHLGAQPVLVSPAAMPRIGTIDERFQSYNIEMIEVTGGRFWKPYNQLPKEQPHASPGE